MDENFLKQLNIALKEETQAYEEMVELYEKKKNILINKKIDDLLKIDDKIIENFNLIKTLDKYRLTILEKEKIEKLTLDEMIELAEKIKSPLKSTFEGHKVKLSEVSRELMLLESTNVELIKHGLITSDKILGIITSALTPQTEGYDKKGKNLENETISISSIIEEA